MRLYLFLENAGNNTLNILVDVKFLIKPSKLVDREYNPKLVAENTLPMYNKSILENTESNNEERNM